MATYGHANGAQSTGWDLDQLVFDSAPGGGPEPDVAGQPVVSPTIPSGAPKVTVVSANATTWHLQVSGATKSFWLVLGETQNRGWQASVSDGPSLGGSTLVDGFANGWKVDPASLGSAGGSGTFDVTLDLGTSRAGLDRPLRFRRGRLDLPPARIPSAEPPQAHDLACLQARSP